MAKFEGVDVSPNMRRLQKAFLKQVKELFQNYLDESGDESYGFIEGMDITFAQAVEFVNDVLLYAQDGEELTDEQRVTNPQVAEQEGPDQGSLYELAREQGLYDKK